jgi:hypothetical protein
MEELIMNDYKSIQDLIVKAALYDGVATTISPPIEDIPALKITFSKGDRHITTHIDMGNTFRDHESMVLYCCKNALHNLLWGRYDEIECERTMQND